MVAKADFDFQDTGAVDVVVIDDEESMCEGCRQTLEEEGYRSLAAHDGTHGLELVKQSHPNVVLLDLKMPGMNGLEVLPRIHEIDTSIVPIIITGFGTIDSAVESMKIGAFDFITKPFEPEKLLETVARGVKLSELRKESKKREEIPAPVKKPEQAPVDKQGALLKGLEALGEYYALGYEEPNFYNELKYLEAEAKYHAESLGQVKKREKAILDAVNQLRTVDIIIGKYSYKKNALIQILLDIQNEFNWLPHHILNWVSIRLTVPIAKIYTLAHFYEVMSLEPKGKHTIQVCEGTACHVRGSSELMRRVSALLGIKPGETDKGLVFTLKSVHCLGCCALAPVMKIDENYYSNPSIKMLKEIFATYREKEETACLK
jgi:NADH:ubiquinone oxidoreductase subunit E/CheY-like chemotaxis protein